MSPHLFTHLFVGGVIVSTRKLVYDSGSAEDAIKSLMQAQHKAVLKDLKRGHFDDKIDEYLGNEPGLLPRGSTDAATVEAIPAAAAVPLPTVPHRVEPALEPAGSTKLTQQVTPDKQPTEPRPPVTRTKTADRGSAPSTIRTTLGPPDPLESLDLGYVEATTRTLMPASFHDSSPEIEIQLELDDDDDDLAPPPVPQPAGRTPSGRSRQARDTDLAPMGVPSGMIEISLSDDQSDGVPGAMSAMSSAAAKTTAESPPPLPPPTPDRRPSLGSTLPPARPITRPPNAARGAMTPPQVMSRPLAADDPRFGRRESDAIEVYAPAPPSAELPGAAPERPGSYSQHKKTQRVPTGIKDHRSGAIPVPPGLGRPGRAPSSAPIAAATPSTGRSHARSDASRRPRRALRALARPRLHARAPTTAAS